MSGYRRRVLRVTGSGAVNGAEVIPATLVEDYASVGIQITGTFVGTVALQVSNDATNWFGTRVQATTDMNSVPGGFTAPGAGRGDLGFRYFRAVISAYTSGTIAGDALFTQDSVSPVPRTVFPTS